MDDKDILKELKQQASGTSIKVDKGVFTSKNDTQKEPDVDNSKSFQEPKTFEERLAKIGTSKDEIIDILMQITEKGFYSEEAKIFGNRITVKFKTSKLSDSKDFIELFDLLTINTEAKAEYYLNLYSLAGILISYNSVDLSEKTPVERADYIMENIPVPIYRKLLDVANKFHTKIELLSSEEVADFF